MVQNLIGLCILILYNLCILVLVYSRSVQFDLCILILQVPDQLASMYVCLVTTSPGPELTCERLAD
jgi:hypothetical protein